MTPDARTAGLSRRHRFTAQGSFGAILRSSRKVRGRYVVVHAARGRPGCSRLGIALTRRLVGSAVHRNRIKRCVRETFRQHPVKRVGLDLVLTLRERYDPREEAALLQDVRSLFDRILADEGR